METDTPLEAFLLDTSARRDVARRITNLIVKAMRGVGKADAMSDAEVAGEVADDLAGIVTGTPGLQEAILLAAKACGIELPPDRAPFVLVVGIDLLNLLAHGPDTLFGP
ncbi:MAG: hypothetical protein JWN24_2226 [Phycisphaerales bacterium]|nr:hypothetical protein [Phycisphaerales bacterium]